MDPVWVLFWSMLILYAGFFIGWVVPGIAQSRWRMAYQLWQQLRLDDGNWRLIGPWDEYARDVIFGFAALSGILGVSLGTAVLFGNPLGAETCWALALSAGLAWGASEWLPKRIRILLREGNHWHPPCETWGERLARWGFPTSEQMRMAEFRNDLQGRLSLASRPHRLGQRGDQDDSLSCILPPW